MRFTSYALVTGILAAQGTYAAIDGLKQSPDPTLQISVERIAAQHHGHVTLFAEDLNTSKTVSVHGDQPVATASVIKLAILFEALEQIRAGTAKWNDPLTLTKQDQVGGSGILLFLDTPKQLTLKDVLTLMIVMSDNTGTNLVIDHLGLANINERIAKLGLHTTYLYKKVFLPGAEALTPALEADQKKFGLGKTSARDMVTLIQRLYACELGNPGEAPQAGDMALCTTALSMLGDQFYRGAIPRYLDGWNAADTGSGTAIGNKSGALEDVRNDVAIVATKRGPIFMAAFTYDNRDQSWQNDNEGELTIAKLAKAVVQSWSPEGLAPNEYKVHLKAP